MTFLEVSFAPSLVPNFTTSANPRPLFSSHHDHTVTSIGRPDDHPHRRRLPARPHRPAVIRRSAGGFEIEPPWGRTTRQGAVQVPRQPHHAEGQESRDDRYVAALDLAGGKTFALAYIARAVTPGDFYLPGAEILDMYHAGVNARTAGGRAQIRREGVASSILLPLREKGAGGDG